jgi:hypothetical protein
MSRRSCSTFSVPTSFNSLILNCLLSRVEPEKNWWAGQDSNLQPDRYERPALTVELPALAGLDRSRVLAWAAGPLGPSRISAIQPKEKYSTPTPLSFRMAFGVTPGSAH